MKLLSVNVSPPVTITHRGKTVTTGIFKKPVLGRVALRTVNLDGDGQADLESHGGIHKAAYVYSIEHHEHWKRDLGRTDLTFGHFGENFTVEGMLEDDIHVGDIFAVGSAVVQVTQPRTPCHKLGIAMGSGEFPKRFLASDRVGFYLRVLEEGDVGAGDIFERIRIDPERMTVREVSRVLHFDRKNVEGTRRALRIQALSPDWRQSLEERLTQATGPPAPRQKPTGGKGNGER